MKPIADLRLADVMERDVFSVSSDSLLAEMIERMRHHHVSHVVVIDGGSKPVGIFTERDLVRLLHQQIDRRRSVSDVMSSPVMTVPATLGFKPAYVQLCLSRLRHLVVVDTDGQVIGVAAERDFLGHLGLELFQSVRCLHDLIDRDVPRLSPDLPVIDAIDLMLKEKRGCVAVVDGPRLRGIFTEHQAPTVLARHADGTNVALSEVLHQGVMPVTEDATVADVIAQLVLSRLGYVVIVDDEHQLIGVIAQSRLLESVRATINSEVAAKQLVEDQLRMTKMQLEAMLELTPNIAVQWYDRDGCIQYWNRAAELLYGWAEADTLGKPIETLNLLPQEASKFRGYLAEIERTQGIVGPMECQIRNRRSELRWVESTLFPIPGNEADEYYFVRTDIDITARNHNETLLKDSSQYARSLIEASLDPLVTIIDISVIHDNL